MNEGLIATVLKPEIDKYDLKRSNQQSLQREKAYQIQVKEADKEFIENSFITANPADGFANADKFARRFAAREGTTVGVGRLAFADYLVNAVSNDDITYPEAMSIINHEEQARDGSMKSMTSWKEWEDLPERLSGAAKLGTEAREDKRDNMIAGDLQIIRSKDDWTNDEKQWMNAYYKDKYDGYVPVELQGALLGYEEDYLAEERIENQLRRQDGILYDWQLANTSNEVYNKYKDKISGVSALTPGTGQAKLASQYIRAATNQGTEDEIGEGDPATEEWLNLNTKLTELFNQVYQNTLFKDGVKVATNDQAFNTAKDAIFAAVEDENTRVNMMAGEYDSTSDEAKLKNIAIAMSQGGGGQWKQRIVTASLKDKKGLLDWSKTPLLLQRDIPEHYIQLAERLGVSPFDLAQRQVALISQGESEVKDRDVDEIENTPNRARLLYHYPTRSRYSRAFIDFGYEQTDSEANVTNSIYNKKVLLTPGV